MPYQKLTSYQQAKIIYDFTVEFCKKYVDKKSRTYDQMVQAARSGKQNIVEGTANSKIKPKSEIFLLGIASASLKELLEDYKDYLRQRQKIIWDKDNPEAVKIRQLVYESSVVYKKYQLYLENDHIAANAMICLINQTTYLLDQQIRAIKRQMDLKGITIESKEQKLICLQNEKIKKEKEFNKKLQDIIDGKVTKL